MKISRGMMTFMVITGIAVFSAVTIFLLMHFGNEKKRSDELMKKFRDTEADLQKSLDSLERVTVLHPDSIKNNQ